MTLELFTSAEIVTLGHPHFFLNVYRALSVVYYHRLQILYFTLTPAKAHADSVVTNTFQSATLCLAAVVSLAGAHFREGPTTNLVPDMVIGSNVGTHSLSSTM